MFDKAILKSCEVTPHQLQRLFAAIDAGRINGTHVEAFLSHENPFKPGNFTLNFDKMYQAMGMNTFKGRNTPMYTHWEIPVYKGVTVRKAIKALQDLGVRVEIHADDLNNGRNPLRKNTLINDRNPEKNGNYQVAFKKSVSHDDDFYGVPADTLKERNIQGITLLERLLLELGFFLETGSHLDLGGATLCSGSRYPNKNVQWIRVPWVRWDSDFQAVYIYSTRADIGSHDFSTRQVMEFKTR